MADTPKEKDQKEKAEGAGTAAASGLGCLGFATLPWSIIGLVIIFIAILWYVHSCVTGRT